MGKDHKESRPHRKPYLSIVTTTYFSEGEIQRFCERAILAADRTGLRYEIIVVDDGSEDNSVPIAVKSLKDAYSFSVITLTKNFGHHNALLAGLEKANGEIIFLIDSDLEEDPELLEPLLKRLFESKDCDVAYAIQFGGRKGNIFEAGSGRLFYYILRHITRISYPANQLTARVMTRRYVDAVISHKEVDYDLWTLFALTGYRQTYITATKGSKGSSRYTLNKKIKMATTIVTSTSSKPLVYIFILGCSASLIGVALLLYLVASSAMSQDTPSGWTSLITSIWLIGGLNIFSLGIVGLYLSKVFNEVKGRPRYLIDKQYNKEKAGLKND